MHFKTGSPNVRCNLAFASSCAPMRVMCQGVLGDGDRNASGRVCAGCATREIRFRGSFKINPEKNPGLFVKIPDSLSPGKVEGISLQSHWQRLRADGFRGDVQEMDGDREMMPENPMLAGCD